MRNLESLKFILNQMEEIRKLYDLSEAEAVLVGEMLIVIKSLGYTPELALKLMKAATAILEVTIEHWDDKNETN